MSNKAQFYDTFHEKQIEFIYELQDLLNSNKDPEYIRNVYADMSRSLYSEEIDDLFRYDLMTFSVDDICGHVPTKLEPGICLADVYVHIPCKDPFHAGVHTSLISHLGGVGCLSCYENSIHSSSIFPME